MNSPMNLSIRSTLGAAVVAVTLAAVLAACGTTTGAPGSESPTANPTQTPAPAPSEPATPTPDPTPAERVVDGVITVYPGTWSGPGASIQEALDNGPDLDPDVPSLVNGVLFRDTDGRIYLADAVSDTAVPTFERPMLEVLGYENDGELWNMDEADLRGLEEANGIIFQQDSQILGILELP
jgi:hypothetical protein